MLTTLAAWLIFESQQDPGEQIYEAVSPSVLTLNVERGMGTSVVGTAFLAIRKGVAVTAWHVIKGAKEITARYSDGSQAKVLGIIDKNPERDIAIIQIEPTDHPILALCDNDPRVGSRAYVIGSPKGMDFSMSDGIIGQMPTLASGKLYQFTCPVSPGNSGGPLLNSAGRVLGIVSWQYRDAQNLNFAVPASQLEQLDIDKKAVAINELSIDTISSSKIYKEGDDSLFKDVFQHLEIRPNLVDDGTGKSAFMFESEGSKISLFQYAKDSNPGPTLNISLSSGYQLSAKADLERLNIFNRDHRFARCYRDSSGIVYLENDLDFEAGIGLGTIVHFVSDYLETLSIFETEILGKESDESMICKKVEVINPKDSADNEKRIVTALKECGYAPIEEEDGTGKHFFRYKVGEFDVSLYQFSVSPKSQEVTSLTVSVGFQMDHKASFEKVNLYNEKTRYLKAFIDQDGDPFLIADLDLRGGVTVETIKKCLKSFAQSIPEFRKEVIN